MQVETLVRLKDGTYIGKLVSAAVEVKLSKRTFAHESSFVGYHVDTASGRIGWVVKDDEGWSGYIAHDAYLPEGDTFGDELDPRHRGREPHSGAFSRFVGECVIRYASTRTEAIEELVLQLTERYADRVTDHLAVSFADMVKEGLA